MPRTAGNGMVPTCNPFRTSLPHLFFLTAPGTGTTKLPSVRSVRCLVPGTVSTYNRQERIVCIRGTQAPVMPVSEGIAVEGHYVADRRERYGPDPQSVQDSGRFVLKGQTVGTASTGAGDRQAAG
jgi:hypothetical protein